MKVGKGKGKSWCGRDVGKGGVESLVEDWTKTEFVVYDMR